ncbi:MAG: HAMP domain-containing protein [Candidatus Binataceae bacterium]|nr:HAMP domain-containing protein [Candidatus Binataceae bacterium]
MDNTEINNRPARRRPPVKGKLQGNGKSNGNKPSNVEQAQPEGRARIDARMRSLLQALIEAADGNFSVRLKTDENDTTVIGQISQKLNEVVARNEAMAHEIMRVERVVRREGRMNERATLDGARGGWRDSVDSINDLISGLVQPTTEVARVIMAVAEGDLTQKIALEIDGEPVKGEFLQIGTTVNSMVDQLSSFAAEVTRVAKEVGTDGKLGGQAEVKGVSGTWKDLTDNVNVLAGNLTDQVRNIAEVTTAVAKGDLSKKITVDARGEVRELKNTINTMVDQLNSFAAEVTRVAKEVGTDGKLGGQAEVRGVSGVWKDLTDNVNFMASNLTTQVRGIVKVITAVADGDLTQKLVVEAKGEIAALADTLNNMTNTLAIFAEQVTSVAKTVGVEGKLGAQAEVPGVAGTWKDLTDNVNLLANNLTAQVRNIAEVTTAVAKGDLSKKISVDARGEVNELKGTINIMVDQLRSFASEVTRVAKEVGTDGKLGGQAEVRDVSGTWKDLTDNVNGLARNLTDQVRNIATVTTAVANGDLSQKITVDVRGEVLELKNTINTMVDQLRSFAAEVTRVAKEVGTEGRLGGQADVRGVSGVWKDLTDNVNGLARNLTDQVRNIAEVTTSVAKGDLSKKISVDARGEVNELKDTINTMVDQLRSFASEVTRVAREVGTEGELGGQAQVRGVSGVWKDLTDNVNFMARNLTTQVRGIVKVVTAVANGDLKQKLFVDARGEVAALAETINSMTDTLSTFAEQVSTVAREVGVEGKLGGQARVPGVAGTWKDLTDNVNFMASNLTTQVRGIVKVVTAVANGDLSQKLVGVEAKGEIAALADTINSMTDTLGTFADQVSTVAREVGIEGKLGGQAKVPGAAGTWRGLTDNVNQLAGNLTTQVRAISEVATAVTNGDLTRSITVGAEGEVAQLKDNINQMIINLRETTQKNTEQDWLKTNLARFSSMMQGQKNLESVSRLIMSELTPLISAHHGAFFLMDGDGDRPTLKLTNTYAYRERKGVPNQFKLGEGLVGQCALEKKTILLTKVPADYIQINSGLGEASPVNLVLIPILFEGEVKAVIELASFHPFSLIHQLFLDQLSESIGVVVNMIMANMRTEQLLQQSQGLTQELQNQSKELTEQQDALKSTNTRLERQALELEEKARLLEEQNTKVEEKNREVEQARVSLEEKAEQLALVSKYKSEFLANMSHELRTPLNSLLILAKVLSENEEGNLSPRQLEYARTINASGADLLKLINEVLDLSKVEAGRMEIEPRNISVGDLATFVERNFRAVAAHRELEFTTEVAENAPAIIRTDPERLQQVLKNLLDNAFKFTEKGGVHFHIGRSEQRLWLDESSLEDAAEVCAIYVRDTGIGIPKDKQQVIFEAFQQADGTTNRKYGGTGLGLSISREITRLLGGEIQVESSPGEGSTFTVYLPVRFTPPDRPNDRGRASRNSSSAAGEFLYTAGSGRHGWINEASHPADKVFVVDEEDSGKLYQLPDGSAVANKRALVVDDDIRNIFAITSLLERHRMNVIYAEDGRNGIKALRDNPNVDVVLMDIMMPEIDGYETIRMIREEEQWKDLPIIAVTARALKEDRDRCLSAGASDYLAKPIDEQKLIELIATWTHSRSRAA